MIDVALPGIIRRRQIRDQVPQREIARRLGISRNTARRHPRSEITGPSNTERRSRGYGGRVNSASKRTRLVIAAGVQRFNSM